MLGAGGVGEQRIAREVRHELLMLPYYGVFDNLAYRVNGDTVALIGSVTRPTLKSGAENVVMKIEGVKRVEDHIEVLPLSPNDDRIRVATDRAIYAGRWGRDRYALQAVPPIHIVVKMDNVHVEGGVERDGQEPGRDAGEGRFGGVLGDQQPAGVSGVKPWLPAQALPVVAAR